VKIQDPKGHPVVDIDTRLSLDDVFTFACDQTVPCFTECCGKLELRLPPYDALRLRRRLGLSGEVFLDRHCIIRHRTDHGLPEVMLAMEREGRKRCPFVTESGCTVYEDRPAACRTYPLGRASTKTVLDGKPSEFYFVVQEAHCKGFEQTRKWTVQEWITDQGLEEYNRQNDRLMELYVFNNRLRGAIRLSPQHIQMYIMALYNPDRFRDFVFNSGFLDKFDLEPDLVGNIQADDEALLEFAFRWLQFALFRQPVLRVRETTADSVRARKPGGDA
jgi:hypothetical protein